MRKQVIIATLLLLASCAFAAELEEQATLQTNGPADLLLDHLDQIETDVRTEQFKHQELYESQHAECKEEIETREKAISDGEDALTRSQAQLARAESSYQEAEADLAQVQTYQTEIKGTLQSLALRRATEKDEFHTLVDDELTPAIEAVEGAFPIIEEFEQGAKSFVQVTRHMAGTFKAVVKSGKGSLMAAPLSALLALGQSTGGFDPAELAQVRSLFENLLDSLQKAKADAIELESTRQETYDGRVADFNGILDKLTDTATELTAYSAELQSSIVEETSISDSATSKIRNNKKALKYAVEMCSAFETEYENASAGRKAEIELLEKLKEFIKEEADIFGDYGPSSTDVFEDYKKSKGGDQAELLMFLQTRQEKAAKHHARLAEAVLPRAAAQGVPDKNKQNLRHNNIDK